MDLKISTQEFGNMELLIINAYSFFDVFPQGSFSSEHPLFLEKQFNLNKTEAHVISTVPGKAIVPNAYNSLVIVDYTGTHLTRKPIDSNAGQRHLCCWVLTPHGRQERHSQEVLTPLQVFFSGLNWMVENENT